MKSMKIGVMIIALVFAGYSVKAEISLWDAINDGKVKLAKILIRKGQQISQRSKWSKYSQETPLHAAARKGYLDIAEMLVAKGAEIDAKDKNDQTPLHIAAANNQVEIAEYLLSKGANIHSQSKIGGRGYWYGTPLHIAALEGHTDMIEFLVSSGADINRKNQKSPYNEYGLTPIFSAVRSREIEAVRTLIRLGADVNIPNSIGRTPLHNAVGASCTIYDTSEEIAGLLLENGADATLKDKYGKTAADVSKIKNEDFLILLLTDKQNPVTKDDGFRIRKKEKTGSPTKADELKQVAVSYFTALRNTDCGGVLDYVYPGKRKQFEKACDEVNATDIEKYWDIPENIELEIFSFTADKARILIENSKPGTSGVEMIFRDGKWWVFNPCSGYIDPERAARAFFDALQRKDLKTAINHVHPDDRAAFEQYLKGQNTPEIPQSYKLYVKSFSEKKAQVGIEGVEVKDNVDFGVDLRFSAGRFWVCE